MSPDELKLLKVRARKALNHAVADGKVIPQPCKECGAPKAQAHHEDYTKPLDVDWLCPRCHTKHHDRQKHPLSKPCEVCGLVFTPHPTKRERAKTCSPACRAKAISQALTANPVIPPWAKLDAEKAAAIRARITAGGVSMRALAREYGVHHGQISAIARGKAWK